MTPFLSKKYFLVLHNKNQITLYRKYSFLSYLIKSMAVNGTKHWEHQHLINYVELVWLITFNLLVVLLEWTGCY